MSIKFELMTTTILVLQEIITYMCAILIKAIIDNPSGIEREQWSFSFKREETPFSILGWKNLNVDLIHIF